MNQIETYQKFTAYYDAYISGFNADIGLYLKYVQPGLKVLEVGCGTGRILKPLVESGAQVTGVDISAEMLAVAKGKLTKEIDAGVVKLLNHDFAKGSLGGDFNRVLITFYTFNYLLDDNESRSFLKNVYQSLEPDGILLVDLFYPAPLLHPELEGKWTDKKFVMAGKEILLKDQRTMVDNVEQRIQIYSDRDRTDEIITRRRYFSPAEMNIMLVEAGFKNIGFISGYQGAFQPLHDLVEIKGGFVVKAEKTAGKKGRFK